MKITKLIAHVSNFLKKKYSKKFLVYHFTANDGDTANANGKYFRKANLKTSAHYFVDDNVVVQSVEDEYVAYAVGGKKLNGNGGKYHGVCTNSNSKSSE